MATYGAPLMSFALRLVRDPELAKDVRQQVFLEVFQGLDRFQGRSSLWVWLCGITYHRCMDELRRMRKAKQTVSAEQPDVQEVLAGEPDAEMDDDRLSKRRALERCLAKFSALMRAQLLMRFFFGLSHQEIGKLVKARDGTVQVRLSRDLPRLRRCLRGEGLFR
jgi:RNA polymerase sigma-70 factor (ECF subfamily)